MARLARASRTAGGLLLLASLASLLVAELARVRTQRARLGLELSVLQERLVGFTGSSGGGGPAAARGGWWEAFGRKGTYLLPAVETLVNDNGDIIGDPDSIQKLLYFSIIGFGKCGTSSLMHWLEKHPGLQVLKSEVWALSARDPARLIRRIHRRLPADLPRGYKCPGDVLTVYVMDYYRRLWPRTKLFVGVRHPVLWFQSLYNFRVQNFQSFREFPHPNELFEDCAPKWSLMCAKRGFFGYHLMKLGKSRPSGGVPLAPTALEYEMMAWMGVRNRTNPFVSPLPNEIFLFELQQLSDQNEARHERFKADIQDYLSLSQPLPDMIHFTPGRVWHDELQQEKDAKKIDICQDQFLPLRRALMKMSRMSSRWIRDEFLGLPSVHVSSDDYVRQILETEWMVDPCGSKSDDVTDEELAAILLNTTGKRVV